MQFSSDSSPHPTSGNRTLPATPCFSLGRSTPSGRKQKLLDRLRKSATERKKYEKSTKMDIDDNANTSTTTHIRPVSLFRGVNQYSPSLKQLASLEKEMHPKDRPSNQFLFDMFGMASAADVQTKMREEKESLMPLVKQQVANLNANNPVFKDKTPGQVANALASAPTIECTKLMMFSMLLMPTCKTVRPGGRNDFMMNLSNMGIKVSCELDDFDEAFDCPIELMRVRLPSGEQSLWSSLIENGLPHLPTSSSQGQEKLATTLAAFLVDQETTLLQSNTATRKELANAFIECFYSNSLANNAAWLMNDCWQLIESKMESFKKALQDGKDSGGTEVVAKYEQIIKCIEDERSKQEACRDSDGKTPASFESLARQLASDMTEVEKKRIQVNYDLEKQRLTNDQADKIRNDEAEKRRLANDQADKIRNYEASQARDESHKEMMKLLADSILTASGKKRPREEAALAHVSTTAHQIPCSPAPSAAAVTATAPSSVPPTPASLTNPTTTTNPAGKRIRHL